MDQIIYDKINTFFQAFTLVRLRKGQAVLALENDKPDILWIRQGIIRMYQIADDGSEITLHFFRAPAFFPMMFYLSRRQGDYFFQAAESVIARKASAEKVEAFLKQNPDVLFDLTRRFADAITGLLLRIEQLSAQDSYQRVASLLLYLAQNFGQQTADGQYVITRRISHRDLASWVGVARETVSHQMERLTKAGIIAAREGKLIILDTEKLKAINN